MNIFNNLVDTFKNQKSNKGFYVMGLLPGIFATNYKSIVNAIYNKEPDVKRTMLDYSTTVNSNLGKYSNVAQTSKSTKITEEGKEGYTDLGKSLKIVGSILSMIPTPYTQAAGTGINVMTSAAPLVAKDGMVVGFMNKDKHLKNIQKNGRRIILR